MTQSSVETKPASSFNNYAWVILFVVFIAGVAAPLNQNKVPPLMPLLMDHFQMSLSQGGWLISAFAITGLILAFPAGIILQKLGGKTSGLIAVTSLLIGSLLGIYSNSLSLFLISRVIEGLGMGLIAVVGPAVIAMWFPQEKQGTPMGIWALWSPMGGLLMYNLAPTIANNFGWQAVWWFGAIFAAIALLLLTFLMRKPPALPTATQPNSDSTQEEVAENAPKISEALSNKNVWLLSIQFSCFVFALIAFSNYYPTFLANELGYSLVKAGSITSIPTFVILVSSPFSGWISDKIGSRKLMSTIPLVGIGLMMLLPFHLSGWQIPFFLFSIGIISGAVPTAVFASIPEVMSKPQLIGIAMGILITGQNLGVFAGPVVFGMIAENVSWAAAGYMLTPICLAGAIAGWLVKIR